MDARLISFGLIEVDGQRYEHDVVLEGGVVRRRKKGPSKVHRERYGHTPLSVDEAIPWSASVLIIGTGASGRLPIMPELYEEARRRGVEVVAEPTEVACRLLQAADPSDLSAILHVTC
ncbi:MAG: MTH938/NDUFAF3 family protein [Chloroflexota bacterium]